MASTQNLVKRLAEYPKAAYLVLFFFFVIHDMSISIDQKRKLMLQADDSAILSSYKDPDVI